MSSTESKKIIFNNQFEILEKIGNGSFGRIYRARDITTHEQVAIKVEKVFGNRNTMIREVDVYKTIGKVFDRIPRFIYFSQGASSHIEETDKANSGSEYVHQYMVMELLGPSLADMKKAVGGKIPWIPLAKIALQCISNIAKLHNYGFIHRDIKPENLVKGLGTKSGMIYIIDFGLSQRWEPLIDKYRRNDDENGSIVGTARYMSINVHNERVYGCRDDLESLGYVLAYLFLGSLPWQGVQGETHRMRMRKILKKKKGITNIFIRTPTQAPGTVSAVLLESQIEFNAGLRRSVGSVQCITHYRPTR